MYLFLFCPVFVFITLVSSPDFFSQGILGIFKYPQKCICSPFLSKSFVDAFEVVAAVAPVADVVAVAVVATFQSHLL